MGARRDCGRGASWRGASWPRGDASEGEGEKASVIWALMSGKTLPTSDTGPVSISS